MSIEKMIKELDEEIKLYESELESAYLFMMCGYRDMDLESYIREIKDYKGVTERTRKNIQSKGWRGTLTRLFYGIRPRVSISEIWNKYYK